MRVSLAELFDRITIVTLKLQRLTNTEHMVREKTSIIEAIEEYKNEGYNINPEWFDELYNINASIWNLEADLRNGKEGLMSLEEVGRRAIAIRNWNKKRIEVKNKISEETETGFQEIKVDHCSEKDEVNG